MLRIILLIGVSVLFESSIYGQDQMHGHWELDLPATLQQMPVSVKNKYDSLSSEIKSRAVASMTGRAFTFTADSVYVDWSSRGQSKRTKGIWSFSSQESELLITVGNDQQKFVVFFQLNGDMIIKNTKPIGFFYLMYLRKN